MNSVFEIFKIGIGPSSSHTVGPMKAAACFRETLNQLAPTAILSSTSLEVEVELYGSLACTGTGHGTDRAIALGMLGHHPETVDPDSISSALQTLTRQQEVLRLHGTSVNFSYPQCIRFRRGKWLPLHSNGMRFQLRSGTHCIVEQIYYSVGGGFIVQADPEHPEKATELSATAETEKALPFPFTNARQLLEWCEKRACSIAEIAWLNERSRHDAKILDAYLQRIWTVMQRTIERGCHQSGMLPGGLEVPRRAASLFQQLNSRPLRDPLTALDWVNLWAIATNEENASGGRIVTAPTNGAAGIIPAVLSYFDRFHHSLEVEHLRSFFLTATAIGSLYKRNASISGAEVGCQGEVGVACSMAAGGLAAMLGGSNAQIENAAEIGMEHNLGLTCDPIAGLVQIPCIERNAMGATKAISAARLALQGSGQHVVSLDKVIATMRRTGMDMKRKYKETSRGGLAVSAVDC